MWFKRMPLEEWFDKYQYEVEYDIGESAVKFLTFDELNIDLGSLPLRYGYHLGRPDLREEIAKQYDGLTLKNIVVTTGASEANFCTVSALCKPGDHVIVEHPNYPSLYEVPCSLGCELSFFSLKFENNFRPEIDDLRKLIRPNTKLISLTHPNNPTGSILTVDELREYIELAEEKDIYLMFDETYRKLAFSDELPGAASLSPKVISISSMSKSYGIPGIRTGWLACLDDGIIDEVLAIREQLTITNSSISEEIALQVLRKKEEYISRALEHIRKNLNMVSGWIDHCDELEWIKPEAGVVSFPRICTDRIVDPEKVYRILAEKYKTFVIPGRCFEMDNEHFRLGYGGTYEEIETGLSNLGKALHDI
ncbi:MAG: aminotransferase class I/II-fold pyridoxal phosphate-dependent enzyme [bacterium]|nr:aminotransferase class I/II-fold pyridoxal phosphate-dependent enzyme [bacterium]